MTVCRPLNTTATQHHHQYPGITTHISFPTNITIRHTQPPPVPRHHHTASHSKQQHHIWTAHGEELKQKGILRNNCKYSGGSRVTCSKQTIFLLLLLFAIVAVCTLFIWQFHQIYLIFLSYCVFNNVLSATGTEFLSNEGWGHKKKQRKFRNGRWCVFFHLISPFYPQVSCVHVCQLS